MNALARRSLLRYTMEESYPNLLGFSIRRDPLSGSSVEAPPLLFFLHPRAKILAPKDLRDRGMGWRPQNLEPMGLIRKILPNKDLRAAIGSVPSTSRPDHDGTLFLWNARADVTGSGCGKLTDCGVPIYLGHREGGERRRLPTPRSHRGRSPHGSIRPEIRVWFAAADRPGLLLPTRASCRS